MAYFITGNKQSAFGPFMAKEDTSCLRPFGPPNLITRANLIKLPGRKESEAPAYGAFGELAPLKRSRPKVPSGACLGDLLLPILNKGEYSPYTDCHSYMNIGSILKNR